MPNKVEIHSGPSFSWYILTFATFLIDYRFGITWLAANLFIVIIAYFYLRYRHFPIIASLLDSDWYKFLMGQVVFNNFPLAKAKYRFINRGKTQFPNGFDKELRKEIKALSKVRLKSHEFNWLYDNWCMGHDYVNYLYNFRFDPNQVAIIQNGGELDVIIEGLWKEAILWEVPLMAIISELYFKMTGKVFDKADFITKTKNKADKMLNAGVKWSDFGTRRRFSAESQDLLNCAMSYYTPGFIGTSNPYFAMKYSLNPIGTYAHEALMAMQPLYGAAQSNRKWMELWIKEYDYNMRIALTDTVTTDVFLRDFDKEMAEKFAGVRQDSGDPFVFAEKMIKHYESLGIDTKTKKIVFSDSLDADKAIKLNKAFGDRIQCVMGIGTHLSNDCGVKPLNMVIKLTDIDFGDGFKPVVKLSDDKGKHTGDPMVINNIKDELGIAYDEVSV